jgi:hypothetical protein
MEKQKEKNSQIIIDYIYLPFCLLIILWLKDTIFVYASGSNLLKTMWEAVRGKVFSELRVLSLLNGRYLIKFEPWTSPHFQCCL